MNLTNVAQVLTYLTQFTLENQEAIRRVKKTSQAELRRHDSIAATGFLACKQFKIDAEAAKAAGHDRVAQGLENEAAQPQEADYRRGFYTLEEAACYLLECTMATHETLKMMSRPSKKELDRVEVAISVAVEACKNLKLLQAADKARCGRVKKAILAQMSEMDTLEYIGTGGGTR